jgi:hypothetical protein
VVVAGVWQEQQQVVVVVCLRGGSWAAVCRWRVLCWTTAKPLG